MQATEVRKLKTLGDENSTLKRLLAEAQLHRGAQNHRRKKRTSIAMRQAVEDVVKAHGLSERRTCELLGAHRSMVRFAVGVIDRSSYERTSARPQPVRGLVIGGFMRFCSRTPNRINHKRVQRLYREERLQLLARVPANAGSEGFAKCSAPRVRISADTWTSSPTRSPIAAGFGL